MEKTVLIVAAIILALLSYLAFGKPVTIIKMMHGWLALWARLFNSNVLSHEQSTMIEIAKRDPAEYVRKYPTQVTIVRSMGLISIIIFIAALCLIFR